MSKCLPADSLSSDQDFFLMLCVACSRFQPSKTPLVSLVRYQNRVLSNLDFSPDLKDIKAGS